MMLILGSVPFGYAQQPPIGQIANPNLASTSAWQDVLKVKPRGNISSSIAYVQDIQSTGIGDVNLDYYAITIDSAGRTTEEEMTEFRRNISRYVYRSTSYSVEPLDPASAARWRSSSPDGAVMVFKLAAIPQLALPLEHGAVIVSYSDSSHFIFSTVSLSGLLSAGDHPVSGNRAFGIQKNSDGSLTIFTKAADRRKGDNPIYAGLGSTIIFEQGAEVWRGLISNLREVYRDRFPRNLTQHQRVMPESELHRLLARIEEDARRKELEAKLQVMGQYKADALGCGLTPIMTQGNLTLGFQAGQSASNYFTEPVTLMQTKVAMLMTRACWFAESGQSEAQPCADAFGVMRANWGDSGFKHGLELDSDSGAHDGCLRAIRDSPVPPQDMNSLNKLVSGYWRSWKIAAKRREMNTMHNLRRTEEEAARRARSDVDDRSGRVPNQHYDLTPARRALEEARRSRF